MRCSIWATRGLCQELVVIFIPMQEAHLRGSITTISSIADYEQAFPSDMHMNSTT